MIEYFSSNLWLVWTAVCVLALILEVSSGTFYLMCFASGDKSKTVFLPYEASNLMGSLGGIKELFK